MVLTGAPSTLNVIIAVITTNHSRCMTISCLVFFSFHSCGEMRDKSITAKYTTTTDFTTHRKLEPIPCCEFQNRMNLVMWRPKVSSLKLLHLNCKISHLQAQDRFPIPYFSSLYGIIERKTTRIQSGCRSKQDFTKIPNKMDNSLTLVG